jgi:hypothetical protein
MTGNPAKDSGHGGMRDDQVKPTGSGDRDDQVKPTGSGDRDDQVKPTGSGDRGGDKVKSKS